MLKHFSKYTLIAHSMSQETFGPKFPSSATKKSHKGVHISYKGMLSAFMHAKINYMFNSSVHLNERVGSHCDNVHTCAHLELLRTLQMFPFQYHSMVCLQSFHITSRSHYFALYLTLHCIIFLEYTPVCLLLSKQDSILVKFHEHCNIFC